jgi:hypothetical protein
VVHTRTPVQHREWTTALRSSSVCQRLPRSYPATIHH